ncbi:unnamed protein product, partial [Prorocentrum cordatum]
VTSEAITDQLRQLAWDLQQQVTAPKAAQNAALDQLHIIAELQRKQYIVRHEAYAQQASMDQEYQQEEVRGKEYHPQMKHEWQNTMDARQHIEGQMAMPAAHNLLGPPDRQGPVQVPMVASQQVDAATELIEQQLLQQQQGIRLSSYAPKLVVGSAGTQAPESQLRHESKWEQHQEYLQHEEEST